MSDLVVRTADLSRSRPPRWAWERRFAIGSVNLLIGEEGIGKGTLIAWTIAQWTKGKLHGDLHRKRIHVGILGDEDSFDDVWAPRLHVVGADLDRVHLIERGDGDYVDISRDRRNLTREVKRRHIRVLFLDQLLDNLGSGVDADRQKSVRDALRPFRLLARELDIAIVGSLHPNKKADTFRQLVAGSVAFNAVSRSSMLLTEDPNDESRRVFLRGKGNLSALPQARSFSIEEVKFTANDEQFSVSRARDFAHSDWRVKDLIIATDRGRVMSQSKQGDAVALIGQLLPKDGDWHPSKPIYETCGKAGLDRKTVLRAKKKSGIEHRYTSESPPAVEWRWATEKARKDTDNPRVGVASSVSSVLSTREDRKDKKDRKNTRKSGVLPAADKKHKKTRKGAAR